MAGVSAPPVRVLLVDDDPLVRAALSMVLGGLADVEVVGEAGDGEEAVAVAAATAPDVVLMDLRMPRRDGISATRELVGARPGEARGGAAPPHVLVLTTFTDDGAVLAALRAGASGFLLKDTPPADIVRAVRLVAEGEPMLSPAVTRQLIAHATTAEGAPGADAGGSGAPPHDDARRARAGKLLATLTERERDVAVAVGQGLPNADIGARLHLSTATVKAHVSRVMVKLQVANRVQVALVVHDAGPA